MPDIGGTPGSFILQPGIGNGVPIGPSLDGYQDCVFIIPPGTWSNPHWLINGSLSFSIVGFHTNHGITTTSETVNGPADGAGGYSDDIIGSALQLGDINLAAGGNLTARLTTPFSSTFGDSDSVLSFVLRLTGGGGATPRRISIPATRRRSRLPLPIAIHPLETILLQNNISGYSQTFGYQIVRSDRASRITVCPGVASINNADGNLLLGMRVYKGRFGKDNSWNQVAGVVTGIPSMLSLFAYPVDILWNDRLDVYVEFYYPAAATVPANSYLELAILPYVEEHVNC